MPAARGTPALHARALTAAGGIAYWQGDEAARAYYEQALAIYHALDDSQGIADSLQNLAFAVMAADMDEAKRLFSESLARYRELGDELNIASVLGALAWARMMSGHHAEARRAFEEALELNRAQPAVGRANDCQVPLGHLDRLVGDLRGAAASYRTALIEAHAMADATRMLMQLRAIQALASAAGRHPEAVRLAGAVERARQDQGGSLLVPLPGLTDAVEEARRAGAITEAQISETLDEGRTMDLQAAVDLALSLLTEIAEGEPGAT